MKQNQKNEVVIQNTVCRVTQYASRLTSNQPVAEYYLRFVETDEEIQLVADKIVSTLEDGFVCMRKYDADSVITTWNKTSGEWAGLDTLEDLKFYDTHTYDKTNHAKYESFWKVCYNTNDPVCDFIRRYVYLQNRNLFKIAADEMSTHPNYMVGYLDDLDSIEQLCLQVSPASVFSQMLYGKLVFADGKKLKTVIGLPLDVVQTLEEWKQGNLLSRFQAFVRDGVATANDIRKLFDLFKAVQKLSKKRKISWGSYSLYRELYNIVETVEYGCDLAELTAAIAREALMFRTFKPSDLEAITRQFRDVYKMLGAAAPSKPKQNLTKWHYIVSRNVEIKKRPRKNEYKAAVEKINQKSAILGDYLIKCPETEEELYAIGEAYNNCLPTYRDRIIDEGAIIYSMYRLDPMGNIAEDVPSITFEITPLGDFIQIKTFNDQDVDDPKIIAILKEWKKKMLRKNTAQQKETGSEKIYQN